MEKLTTLKPFLFQAYYNWILENKITPHLLVDCNFPGVKVPKAYVKDGNIILSLLPEAIDGLKFQKRGISFKARFKGVSEDIFVPYVAMDQLIALETGSALPIGKALEQLELAPDENYPDDGEMDEDAPLFSLEDEDDDDDYYYDEESDEEDSDDTVETSEPTKVTTTKADDPQKKDEKEGKPKFNPTFSFIEQQF